MDAPKPATPLPWESGTHDMYFTVQADKDYLVHSANSLPGLIQERDRLKEALEKTKLALDSGGSYEGSWREAVKIVNLALTPSDVKGGE